MVTTKLSEKHAQVVEAIIAPAAQFRRIFGVPFSEDLLAEVYVAQRLGLEICFGNNPGFDAVAPDGLKYQIKRRSVATLNVDVNNFDFDHLALVNLGDDLKPLGIWLVSREEIEALCAHRAEFRKFQITQKKLKSLARKLD